MRKPNLIVFTAESYDGRMLGSLGHPALRNATPHIDRIAEEGTIFENAYTSHPICCPARANLWSGRYSHNCESWNNFKGLEPKMWSLLDQMPETHTWKNFGKLDYRSGGHTLQARLTAWLGSAGIDKPQYDKDKSQCFEVADNDDFRHHLADWEKIDCAVDFLKEQKEQQQTEAETKPFFLTISTNLVHAAFKTNRYWLDKIPEEDVDIPPFDPTDHPCRLYQRMTKAWRYGFDEETVRQVRRIYFAMCAELDAMVGTVYDMLKQLGLDDNTYFVFTGDHGEMAMEHREWYKMSMYEGSVRIPMVMTGPDIVSGQRRQNLVSLIDMCPTLMDMVQLPSPEKADGESLLPLARGDTDESRNWAYACFTGTTLNTTSYMLRKGRWKYVVYVGYPSQLFDIESDPQELNDLLREEPQVAAQLDEELRQIVDYEQTHCDVMDYNKNAFKQWRRQAKRGVYVDSSYGLIGNPSSDYWEIMDNAFTGYSGEDERKVEKWLES
ncbi:MAG: sulfatase [Verrucomicrobiota bacterium]